MLKFLINNVSTIRVSNENEANALHKYYEDYARENGYVLSAWSQTYRTKKAQGEIIDSWFVCKATLEFNDVKEPTIPLDTIDFKMQTNISINDVKLWDEI